jgi:uncharacterized protein (DUF58 family)
MNEVGAYVRPQARSHSYSGSWRMMLALSALGVLIGSFGAAPIGLLAGLSLAVLTAAPLLARAHLAGLRAGPLRAIIVPAGRDIAVEIPFENDSFLFCARDLLVAVGDGRLGRERVTGYREALGPGARASIAARPRFVERGRRTQLAVVVSSSFPFGLVTSRVDFEVPIDLLVLPRLGRVRALEERLATARGPREPAHAHASAEGETYGVREWRPGESLRGVHWKLSARRSRKLVREWRSEDRSDVRVILETGVSRAPARGRPHGSFERAVGLAATLLAHFVQQGHAVGLSITGTGPVSFERGSTLTALLPMLAALAEVRAEPGAASGAGRGAAQTSRGELVIVVRTGGQRPRRADGRTPDALVLDVDDPDVEEVFDWSRACALLRSGGSRRPW